MIMTGAAGLPSAKTVLVAVRFKPQPSKPATKAASAATDSAPEASRRADWAASAKDSVSAFGGVAATAGVACGGGGAAGIAAVAGAACGGGEAAGIAAVAGAGANRFAGVAAIASSAPISTYQRNSASAVSRSRRLGGGSAGDVIPVMLPPRPGGGDPI